MTADLEQVRDRYRLFAKYQAAGYSDLYLRLCGSVIEDDAIAAFLAGMPDQQPNLFFAAVQFLTGPELMPSDRAALATFVRDHQDELSALMRTRSTQTNEIGRCPVLMTGVPRGGKVALLEVGASAGLCLLMDRYRYDYGGESFGNASSVVHLPCDVEGPMPSPDPMPTVVWRAGIDLRPVDIMDPDSTKWLLSCVWADHRERRLRLESALEMARAEPPMVHRGDLVEDLPRVLETVPRDALLVVFHSAVLNYISEDHRERFAQALTAESHARDVVWLSNEGPGIVPEVTALAPEMSELRFLLGRTRLAGGERHDELLALSHPHGAQMTWVGGAQREAAS